MQAYLSSGVCCNSSWILFAHSTGKAEGRPHPFHHPQFGGLWRSHIPLRPAQAHQLIWPTRQLARSPLCGMASRTRTATGTPKHAKRLGRERRCGGNFKTVKQPLKNTEHDVFERSPTMMV